MTHRLATEVVRNCVVLRLTLATVDSKSSCLNKPEAKMSEKIIASLIVGVVAFLAAIEHRAGAEEPPAKGEVKGLAAEIVKVEVQRQFDADGKPTKDIKTIEDKEKIGQLLALFPEVGSDKKPDAGGPIGYSAGYTLTLHRKKGDPLYITISHNRKFWCWSEGTTVTNGDWKLKDAQKVEKFLEGLLK
jgi:hypothetical protein